MLTYKGNAFEGKQPAVSEKAYIADSARIVGDVTVGEYSSIWYGCSIRADDSQITIGSYVNVQDKTTIHVDEDYPAIIGDYTSIGHSAVVHGCTVQDHCLIGMKAVLLNGVVIGRGSIVAAGAVVSANTVIPPFSLVVGVPGKVSKQLHERMLAVRHKQALGYKSLWCEHYGIYPDNDGEQGRLKVLK